MENLDQILRPSTCTDHMGSLQRRICPLFWGTFLSLRFEYHKNVGDQLRPRGLMRFRIVICELNEFSVEPHLYKFFHVGML